MRKGLDHDIVRRLTRRPEVTASRLMLELRDRGFTGSIFFGGVPRRIVYDNLKSVVLSRIGSAVQFNPGFLAFPGHCVFEPTAAPVRYPE